MQRGARFMEHGKSRAATSIVGCSIYCADQDPHHIFDKSEETCDTRRKEGPAGIFRVTEGRVFYSTDSSQN